MCSVSVTLLTMVETTYCATCVLFIGVLGAFPSRLISSLKVSHSLSSSVVTSGASMTGGGTSLGGEAITYCCDIALD